MMVWYGIPPTPWLLLVPVLVFIQIVLIVGDVADHLGAARLVPRSGAGGDAWPAGLALSDTGLVSAVDRCRRACRTLVLLLNPMVGMIDGLPRGDRARAGAGLGRAGDLDGHVGHHAGDRVPLLQARRAVFADII